MSVDFDKVKARLAIKRSSEKVFGVVFESNFFVEGRMTFVQQLWNGRNFDAAIGPRKKESGHRHSGALSIRDNTMFDALKSAIRQYLQCIPKVYNKRSMQGLNCNPTALVGNLKAAYLVLQENGDSSRVGVAA